MNLDAAKGGQEYPPIYEHPYWWAKRFGELEQFHASYTQNVACATAINLTLAKHYDFDTGHPNIAPAAKEIVDKFGFDRTMYVLASTVWDYAWDDNISPSSKEWARTIPCYDEPDISRGYSVSGNTDVIPGHGEQPDRQPPHPVCGSDQRHQDGEAEDYRPGPGQN